MSTQNKFKVYVTQPIPQAAKDIFIENNIEFKVNEKTPLSRETLIQEIKGVDGLYCTLNEKINKELLDIAGPQLKVIATCSVGYDHVDLKECESRNIPVGYTPGVLTNATAEFTIGLLLSTTRRICEAAEAAKKGNWADWKIMWMTGRETKGIYGSTVGIFGLGRIGMAIGTRLKPFGINKLIYHNRRENSDAREHNFEYVSLETLLKESDFLICSCASTKETEKIFNKKLFDQMKSTSIFINISRGNVVDQDDLYDALKNKTISAAGLDVTTPEPLPIDHKLFQLDNCLITPHICSAETQTRTMMATITATNIVNGLNNKPLLHKINL